MSRSVLVTARTIALVNLAICEQLQQSFEITRPHNLKLIEKQYQQLSRVKIERRIAHVAYMVDQLSPFAHNNRKTSLLLAQLLLEHYGLQCSASLSELAGLLKHDVGVDVVEQRLCT